MPTYSVGDVLDIIKTLTSEQKLELQRQLSSVLDTVPSDSTRPAKSQSMSGVNITGSSDIDLSQLQADGGSQINQSKTQATLPKADLQEALELLQRLKQAIACHDTLNPLVKEGAEAKIQTIQKEVEKAQPDKDLVSQTISTLKKGLEGVEELAEPVNKVASLVAKAWMVI